MVMKAARPLFMVCFACVIFHRIVCLTRMALHIVTGLAHVILHHLMACFAHLALHAMSGLAHMILHHFMLARLPLGSVHVMTGTMFCLSNYRARDNQCTH